MISYTTEQHYYLYRFPADMRKDIDGFCGLIRNAMKKGPMIQNRVYVFLSRYLSANIDYDKDKSYTSNPLYHKLGEYFTMPLGGKYVMRGGAIITMLKNRALEINDSTLGNIVHKITATSGESRQRP